MVSLFTDGGPAWALG